MLMYHKALHCFIFFIINVITRLSGQIAACQPVKMFFLLIRIHQEHNLVRPLKIAAVKIFKFRQQMQRPEGCHYTPAHNLKIAEIFFCLLINVFPSFLGKLRKSHHFKKRFDRNCAADENIVFLRTFHFPEQHAHLFFGTLLLRCRMEICIHIILHIYFPVICRISYLPYIFRKFYRIFGLPYHFYHETFTPHTVFSGK